MDAALATTPNTAPMQATAATPEAAPAALTAAPAVRRANTKPLTVHEQRELLYAPRREATAEEEKHLRDQLKALDRGDQYAVGELAYEVSTLTRDAKPLHVAWGAETFELFAQKQLKVQPTHAHNCKRVWATFFQLYREEVDTAALRKIPIARLMEIVAIVLDQPTRVRYWVERAQTDSAAALKAHVLEVRREEAKAAKAQRTRLPRMQALAPTSALPVAPAATTPPSPPVALAPPVAPATPPAAIVQTAQDSLTVSIPGSPQEIAYLRGCIDALRSMGSTKSEFELLCDAFAMLKKR